MTIKSYELKPKPLNGSCSQKTSTCVAPLFNYNSSDDYPSKKLKVPVVQHHLMYPVRLEIASQRFSETETIKIKL